MDNECPICLEPMTNTICTFPCNHTFHSQCVMDYISKNIQTMKKINCPICRKVIMNNIHQPFHIAIDISSNQDADVHTDEDLDQHERSDLRCIKACLTITITSIFALYTFTLLNNAQ